MKRRWLSTMVALTALAAPAGAMASGGTFHNPLFQTDSPDPWIQFMDGRYFMSFTTQNDIELRSAPSVVGLPSAAPTRIWPPAGQTEPPERSQMVWGPEFKRLDGRDGARWYVYYAANDGNLANHSMHVLESAGADIRGPYHYKAQLQTGGWAIDGYVYRNPQGKLFLFYSGFLLGDNTFVANESLWIAPMSDPWTISGPPLRISVPTLPWEVVGYPVEEAPDLIEHDGKLNVVFSASQCVTDGYNLGRLTVPVGADLLDPHTWSGAKNPLPIFTSSVENSVYSPGSSKFFRSPDGREDWIAYGAYDTPGAPVNGKGCLGHRELRIQKFSWNADGTPNLGQPVRAGQELPLPSGDPGPTGGS